MPSKSRLQASHNHADLIPLRWSINDLGNLLPPTGMNDVTVSSGLCLKASNSLPKTFMTMLNANCHRNSWAKSSHVRQHDTSKDASQRWVIPLKDMGNSIIIWASSKLWDLITVLYSLKWMRGHPIPMYRLISSILNLADKLATSSPSKSSHTISPSNTFNYLILCSNLSMCAWASSEVGTATMAGGGATSVWLCKVNGVGCGTVWPSRGGGGIWVSCGAVWLSRRDGGIVGSYCTLSWTRTC